MRNKPAVSFFMLAFVFSCVACSAPSSASEDPQVEAIQAIRPRLGLPDLPLEYVEDTGMVNSPSGDWKVAAYQDSEGRRYFVRIETNRVVEIDGRNLLPEHGALIEGALTAEELRAGAEKIAGEVVPDFASLEPKLTYEEGQKGNNYFFTWRDDYSPISFNRPFLQLAFLKNGQLFAYINTLSSK
jgi:hypothetical protein